MRDSPRVSAYAAALKDAVSSDSIVLDLGAGPGMFTLLACAYGAKRVYAIEGSSSVHHLQELAKENGFSDRITVIQGDSRRVSLPERANLLVTDLRGSLPFLGDNLETLADARARHLTPDAILIPKADVVHAVMVRAPTLYDSLASPFPVAAPLTLRSFVDATLNTLHVTRSNEIRAEDVLSESTPILHLDYGSCLPGVAHGTASLRVTGEGMAHGVCLFFEAHTSEAHRFSTAPGLPCVYGRSFLPLKEPLTLQVDDVVRVEVWANPGKGAYLWSWNTDFIRGEETLTKYRQSSFLAEPLDLLGKLGKPHAAPGAKKA